MPQSTSGASNTGGQGWKGPDALRGLLVPIADLHPDPANARRHPERNIEAIVASLDRFGQRFPLVVQRQGMVVRAGNGRLEAMRRMGWTHVAAVVVDESSVEATAFAIADNRTAELAEWDDEALAGLLQSLPEADRLVAGFNDDDLREVMNSLTPEVVEDEAPAPLPDPVSRTGDLWTMGGHRLLCGDSTNAEDVAALLNSQNPALVVADPPYFGKVDEEWDNDFNGYDGFLEFLDGVFGLWIPKMLDRGTSAWWCAPDFAWHIEGRLRKHAAVFNHIVWHKGDSLGTNASVEDMRRWRPRSERLLICEKNHSPDALLASFNAKTAHIAARSAYASIIDRMVSWQKEAGLANRDIDECLGTNGMAGHYFGRSQWSLPTREAWDKMRPLFKLRGVEIGEYDTQRREFDAQRQEFDAQRREFDAQTCEGLTDVWECPAPHGEDRHGHPTPKPLAIISKLVSAHSRAGDLVADPFSGTGTTIIACEQLGRRCFAIEIEPRYVDVGVRRWEKLTGKEAVLESTGRTWRETAAERGVAVE